MYFSDRPTQWMKRDLKYFTRYLNPLDKSFETSHVALHLFYSGSVNTSGSVY